MNTTLRAALWMIGAVGSFTAMALAGRALGSTYDTFEIMLYRSAIGLIIVLAVASWADTLREINTQAVPLHGLRNLVHFIGQNLWFYAVTAIPLAQVFALEFTTPLWVIVLSPLLLGERLTPVRGVGALLGFIGILIVARPGAVTLSAGTIAAASCAIFFALTFVFTKRLTRSQSITAIMFFLTLIQLGLGLLCVFYDGQVTWPTVPTLPLLALVGLCGLLAHFCITQALKIAPATIVAPIDFARLPLVAILAMLIYREPLEVWVFVGAIVIFSGNYLNIWAETRKAG
ncbi:MAG: DMT family transporter [Pseudomonadota bacterium]